MTSEPDSKGGRRPPTIELKATEVDKPSSPKSTGTSEGAGDGGAKPDPGPARGASGSRLKSHVISACIGAIATAAIVGGLWWAGLAPPHEATVSPSAPTPQSAVADTISARLDKIEGAIKAQRQEAPSVLPAPGNRLAADEAQTKSLSESLAVLSRRVDDLAATAQTAQKQADAAAADAAKSAGQSGVQRSEFDALTSRVAALENQVKTLAESAAQPAASADDHAARLTIAAEALRAAVERGAPYQAEFATVQSLGVDHSATAPLEPFAATGIPHAALLAHELATLVPALQQVSDTSPAGTTFLGRLEANAQKLVRITPLDAPTGNDPAALIARIAIDAAHADIAAALTDVAALPDAAKSSAAGWIKQAEARQAAIAASRQIAAAALAALGKPASQ